VVLDQLRTMNKVRLVRRLGRISTKAQGEILRVLAEMFVERSRLMTYKDVPLFQCSPMLQ